MTATEFTVFTTVLAVLVILVYVATSCRVIGHRWKRVSPWNRVYRCNNCGQQRKDTRQ